MSVKEFKEAFDVIEQDHHLVLAKLKTLKETVVCLLDPDEPNPRRCLEQLHDSLGFFCTHFAEHMAEEEEKLFPLLARQPGGAEIVDRLRDEHAEISRKREELHNCLDLAMGLGGRMPNAILRDLFGYGWELWSELDRHAHGETKALQDSVAQLFGAD